MREESLETEMRLTRWGGGLCLGNRVRELEAVECEG